MSSALINFCSETIENTQKQKSRVKTPQLGVNNPAPLFTQNDNPDFWVNGLILKLNSIPATATVIFTYRFTQTRMSMASQQMRIPDAKLGAVKQVVLNEGSEQPDDYMSDQPAADGFNFENVIIEIVHPSF